MLEERQLFAEAKEISLSIIRRAYFDEADLHHTCCRGRAPQYWTQDDDGRFWDIPEQLKVDELNCKIKYFSTKEYQEVKSELMICLWRRWMKYSTQPWPGIHPYVYTWKGLVERKEEFRDALLDVIHVGAFF